MIWQVDGEKTKAYNPGVDLLRIVAIVAVILIHTTTRSLEASGYDLRAMVGTLLVNQVMRFAVPLFFMISGFVSELSWSDSLSYGQYVVKRVSRVAVPYVAWSTIYYWAVFPKHYGSLGEALVLGNASYQLYFIPTLIIFYALFPVLRKVRRYLAMWPILVTLALVQAGLLYYDYFVTPLPIYSPVRIGLLNYGLFSIGLVVAEVEAKIRLVVANQRWILGVTGLILAGVIYSEGLYGYYSTGDYNAFYSQWRPSVMLYALIVGGLLYTVTSGLGRYRTVIKTVAGLTLGVFFVHVLVLERLWYGLGVHNGWWLFGLTAGISFGITYVVHKMPLATKVLG